MIIRRRSGIENDVTASAAANLTIDQLLANQVRKGAHRPFLCDPPNKTALTGSQPLQLTYRETERRVAALATVLRNIGLRRDDIVAVRMPNTAETVIALLAIWRAGLVACPIPLTWRRREWSSALETVSPKALITTTRIGEEDAALTACLIAQERFSIRFVAAFGPDEYDGVISLDRFLGDAAKTDPKPEAEAIEPRERAGDHVAAITFTELASGMVPVPRCHASWIASAMRPAADLGLLPGSRLLSPFMLSHMTGLSGGLLACLLTGAMLVLHHPFDLDTLGAQVASQRPNRALFPSSVANDLLALDDTRSIRSVLRVTPFGVGAEALSAAPEGVSVFEYAGHGEQALLPLARDHDGVLGLRAGFHHVRDNGDYSLVVANVTECDVSPPSDSRRMAELLRRTGQVTEADLPRSLAIGGAMAPDGLWLENTETSTTPGRARNPEIYRLAAAFYRSEGGVFPATGFLPGLGAIGGLLVSLGALDWDYGQIDGAEAAAVAAGEAGLAVGIVPKGVRPLDESAVRAAVDTLALAEHKIAGSVVPLSAIPRRSDGQVDRGQVVARLARTA